MTTDVPCPKCHARPGQPCVTPSGVVRRDFPHKARQKLAEAVRAVERAHPFYTGGE